MIKLPPLTDRASAEMLVGYYVQTCDMFANLAKLLRERGGTPDEVAEMEAQASRSSRLASKIANEARARGFTRDTGGNR